MEVKELFDKIKELAEKFGLSSKTRGYGKRQCRH